MALGLRTGWPLDGVAMRTDIRQHGARGDGQVLDTSAIQAAIDAVALAGGGLVVVPPGRYRVGTIFMRDRVRLHLDAGADLVGSERHEDYAKRDFDGAHAQVDRDQWHLLVADGCRDIALTGQGSIDGSGPAFYHPPRHDMAWPEAFAENRRMRTMVQIHRCQGVLIEDVRLGNVSNWTLHLHESDDITVRGVRIINPPTAPNADGIDITGCRNVRISGCTIDTCDDAVCLKTNPRGRSCEDVTVDGCVIRTHCVGLKIGCFETFQDIRNVAFSNCVVRGSSRAVGLYSHQGATVENVAVSNIVCDTCVHLMFTRPLHIDCRRHPQWTGDPSVLRNILVAGVLAETEGRCLLTAGPGCDLSGVTLRDLVLRYPAIEDPAIRGATVGGGQFSNANPWARIERAALVAEGVRDLVVDGFQVRWPTGPAPKRWRFERKMANGDHALYGTADFALADGVPFAAMSVKDVTGRVRGPLPAGWAGGEALASNGSIFPAMSGA
jgi:hypothetical protein